MLKTNFMNKLMLSLVGAAVVLASSGCNVSVRGAPNLEIAPIAPIAVLIEAVDVCAHVVDNSGDYAYGDVLFRYSLDTRNGHVGANIAASLDRRGLVTPCAFIDLRGAADYSDAIGVDSARITCEDNFSGSEPTGAIDFRASEAYIESRFVPSFGRNVNVLKTFPLFNLDRIVTASVLKSILKSKAREAFGLSRSATLEDLNAPKTIEGQDRGSKKQVEASPMI